MLNKQKRNFYNCSLDLQRASVAFYLNPGGSTPKVFLAHAQEVLKSIKTKKAHEFTKKIDQIQKELMYTSTKSAQKNLADKILTYSCMLKV